MSRPPVPSRDRERGTAATRVLATTQPHHHSIRRATTGRAAARVPPRASRRGADRDSTRRSGRGIGGARRRASSSSSVRSVASSRDARGHVSTRARPRARARIPRGVATVLDASFQPSRRRRRGILTLLWVNSVIEVYTSILYLCNFEHVERARGTEIETWQLHLFCELHCISRAEIARGTEKSSKSSGTHLGQQLYYISHAGRFAARRVREFLGAQFLLCYNR